MITKIKSIQNIATYDHKKDVTLSQYSLIYGFNGSGKTSLSRVFDILTIGKTSTRGVELLEKIKNGDNPSATLVFQDKKITLDSQDLQGKIVLFNKDYVEDNVFTTDGMKGFMLGVENKTLSGYIDKLEVQKKQFDALYGTYDEEHETLTGTYKKESKLDSFYSTTAKEVRYLLDNIELLNDIYSDRKFTKTQVIQLLPEGDKPPSEPTLSADIDRWKSTLTKKEKIDENVIIVLKDLFSSIGTLYDNFPTIQKAMALPIQRENRDLEDIQSLSDDIRLWIQDGLKHHHNGHSKTCLFCNNTDAIEARLKALDSYFSTEYENLQKELRGYYASVASLYGMLEKSSDHIDKALLGSSLEVLKTLKVKIEEKQLDSNMQTPFYLDNRDSLSSALSSLKKILNKLLVNTPLIMKQ